MDKKQELLNLLIERNLRIGLIKNGIFRCKSECFEIFNEMFNQELEVICKRAKAEMLMQGKKVLDAEVLNKVFNETGG